MAVSFDSEPDEPYMTLLRPSGAISASLRDSSITAGCEVLKNVL